MKKVVFFDVDNVLVKGQTQKILLKFFLKRKKIHFSFFIEVYFWFLLYKLNLVRDTVKMRKKSFALFANWDILETDKLFDEFFGQEIKPRISSQSIKIIQGHIKQGYEVVLASASLFEIVDKLNRFLSLNYAISTKLESKNNKYTGKILGSIPYGEDKAREAKKLLTDEKLSLDDSYAYTDHYSDLPLLELVKNPIAVNPDRKLRAIAKKKRWVIYDF